LDEVRDGDKVKHTWLWTTISESARPYDFDGFRVFIWSLRRHRYETAYIERNLRGYFPVKLEQVQYGTPAKNRRGQTNSNLYPGFSVCVQKKDGNRYRRSYAFLTTVVRFVGEKPCEVQPIENPRMPANVVVASAEPPETGNSVPSLFDRFKERLGDLRKRWFGR
jgi:hypothetical protein